MVSLSLRHSKARVPICSPSVAGGRAPARYAAGRIGERFRATAARNWQTGHRGITRTRRGLGPSTRLWAAVIGLLLIASAVSGLFLHRKAGTAPARTASFHRLTDFRP